MLSTQHQAQIYPKPSVGSNDRWYDYRSNIHPQDALEFEEVYSETPREWSHCGQVTTVRHRWLASVDDPVLVSENVHSPYTHSLIRALGHRLKLTICVLQLSPDRNVTIPLVFPSKPPQTPEHPGDEYWTYNHTSDRWTQRRALDISEPDAVWIAYDPVTITFAKMEAPP